MCSCIAPPSTKVVISAGAGVTGCGGGVQSSPNGFGVLIRPKTRFTDFNSGNASLQHLFEKSSKSNVHAAMPPKPESITYLALTATESESS